MRNEQANRIDGLPILTRVRDGQSYVDALVYSKTAKHLLTVLADTMAEIFGHVSYITAPYTSAGDEPITVMRPYRVRDDIPPKILLKRNHTKLRWMKPDGNGGVIPR